MEGERRRFHEAVGRFNEERAMPRGVLLTPVTLVNIRDKRPTQYVIDENIEDSTAWIGLLQDNWGPTERNFENDYHLALCCLSDPGRPMLHVSLLRKLLPSGKPLDPGLPEPAGEFSSPEEFELCVTGQLSALLEKILHAPATAGLHATA